MLSADMGQKMRLPLLYRKTIVGYTLVDPEDYEKYKNIRWGNRKGYATFVDGKTTLSLHRLITNAPREKQVDHINGNTLDNRKSNLRLCTIAENAWNKKSASLCGFKGVYFGGKNNPHKFRAHITIYGKRKHLGYFSSAIEAAKAYDKAALQYFGKFARVNGATLGR